jgi:hypothetical protein
MIGWVCLGVLNNIGAGSMVVVRVCLGIGTYVGYCCYDFGALGGVKTNAPRLQIWLKL